MTAWRARLLTLMLAVGSLALSAETAWIAIAPSSHPRRDGLVSFCLLMVAMASFQAVLGARKLFAVLAVLPCIGGGVFYAFATGWALRLGHWPLQGMPDAGGFHGALLVLDVTVAIALAAGVLSIGPTAGALLIAASRRELSVWRPAALAIGTWLVLFTLLRADPGGCLDWFLD